MTIDWVNWLFPKPSAWLCKTAHMYHGLSCFRLFCVCSFWVFSAWLFSLRFAGPAPNIFWNGVTLCEFFSLFFLWSFSFFCGSQYFSFVTF
ncbi:hypothetical protein FPQ18DRAFT_58469 [Pyronema domesticum]|nr:hypothetical protein FPQ18DRAFT_58469 [Pyronema domesticum]